MNRIAKLCWGIVLYALLLAGCAQEVVPEPTAAPTTLAVSITPDARPITPLVSACAAEIPGLAVQITESFSEYAQGDLHIRLGVPEGFSGFSAQIAEDEITVVLHPENPVFSLTNQEIQALFSGQISNWSQLDGDDLPVSVWVPLAGSEDRVAFEETIMQGIPTSSGALLAPDPAAMLQAILSDSAAIGYLPRSWQASDEMIAIFLGISLPVLVTAPEPPQGAAAQLLACMQGEFGQAARPSVYP